MAEWVVIVTALHQMPNARPARRQRAIQVGVQQMCMNDIRLIELELIAQTADDADIGVPGDRNALNENAARFHQGGVIIQRLPRIVHQDQADIEMMLTQTGQQSQQVTLCTCDAGCLDDVYYTHDELSPVQEPLNRAR